MGLMRFLVPHRERLSAQAVDLSYVAGMEGIPWHTRTGWNDGEVVVARDVDESGNFYIPWRVDGHGEPVLCTSCLMERPEAYHLPVELARGTLNRIRNQLAAWEPAGLVVPESVSSLVNRALGHFARAATLQADAEAAAHAADEAIRVSLDAIELLIAEYVGQALTLRHQQSPKLQTVFGANLGNAPVGENRGNDLLAAFNSAAIPLTWALIEPNTGDFKWTVPDQQIEWCRRRALRTIGGPLLQLDNASLPHWLILWDDDFENLQSYLLGYVETLVKRYQGKVAVWNCTARMNVEPAISLNEEQRLNVTARAIDMVRKADPHTPIIVSFDQPWSEYASHGSFDLTPIHFADALARANLGLSGIGLELNLGYWPSGSPTRDLLEVSRLLDRWSLLGLPLVIYLTVPSSAASDPLAAEHIRALEGLAGQPLSVQCQRALVEKLVPLLLSKPCVHGIIWNQLDDGQPHDFPHGGLFDAEGRPKPSLDSLATIRQEHLV